MLPCSYIYLPSSPPIFSHDRIPSLIPLFPQYNCYLMCLKSYLKGSILYTFIVLSPFCTLTHTHAHEQHTTCTELHLFCLVLGINSTVFHTRGRTTVPLHRETKYSYIRRPFNSTTSQGLPTTTGQLYPIATCTLVAMNTMSISLV